MRSTLALAVVITAIASSASAEPLRVVVRHAGAGDELAIERLAGQIVDLDVEPIAHEGTLERTLDGQIAAAAKLADREGATAVVWFRKDGQALVVAVSTPGDRRVFVRTIDAGDPSATAEASAQAARTALRAIALGGTIGVAMPEPEPEIEVVEPPPRSPTPRWRWLGGAGWQAAADGGADAGAHAIWQRLGVARGHWGVGLGLSLGAPLRKDGEIGVDLSRSTVLATVEQRRGDWRFGVDAGVAFYHRATIDVPSGLAPTDSQVQAAFVTAPEVRWVVHPGGRGWGLEVTAALDVVLGAPELQVDRGGGNVDTLAKIAMFQPRIGIGVVVGP